MGNPKQKWTAEEEEALRAGIAKHGTGKWKNIQKDPEFNHLLFSRSNIDLKDKWRNMSVNANGLGPREKSRTPKAKAVSSDAPATPLLMIGQAPASSATPSANDALTDAAAAIVAVDDSAKCSLDGNTASKYNAMIYEALSTLKDPNGSDTNAIVAFIEQRQEVPQNFRRLLMARLRRLVAQDKLEKVQTCYRMKTGALPGTAASTPKQKEIPPRQSESTLSLTSTEQVTAENVAYRIADAENKAFVAAEAFKENEKISKMAEEANNMLLVAQAIFDHCSRGDIFVIGA